jgi:hypothetical protein
VRSGRLAILAALVLAATASVGAADAVAEESIEVTVGQSAPQTIAVSQLEANCPQYSGALPALYNAEGTPQPGLSAAAWWSLQGVLSCLATPVGAFDELLMIGDGVPDYHGAGSLLSQADLSAGAQWTVAGTGPVIGTDANNDVLQYARPQRPPAAGAADDNAADWLDLEAPAALAIDVFTGPAVPVTVAAPATVTANAPATLTAAVAGAPPGIQYSWSASPAAQPGNPAAPSPNFTFPAAGTYTVDVVVTDAAGGGGVGTTTVTVGPASTVTTPATTTPAGGATGLATTPATPPRRKRRATKHRTRAHASRPKQEPAAPLPAASPTTTQPAATTRARTRARARTTTQATGASPAPRASSTPPVQTTPVTSAAAPATTAATVAPPVPPATHNRPAPKRPPAPGRTSTTVRSTRASPQAARVEGVLIADVIPLAADRSPLVRAAGQTAAMRSPRSAPGSSALPTLAGMLVLVLLFSAGVTRELRWRHLRSAR